MMEQATRSDPADGAPRGAPSSTEDASYVEAVLFGRRRIQAGGHTNRGRAGDAPAASEKGIETCAS